MEGGAVKLTELFIEDMERERDKTRKAVAAVPEGKGDWKPHDKSMPFGRLAGLVARMPSWFALIVKQDELNLTPPPGSSNVDMKPLRTAKELVEAHDAAVAEARKVL